MIKIVEFVRENKMEMKKKYLSLERKIESNGISFYSSIRKIIYQLCCLLSFNLLCEIPTSCYKLKIRVTIVQWKEDEKDVSNSFLINTIVHGP